MSDIEYSFGNNTKATTEATIGDETSVVSKSAAPVEFDFEEKDDESVDPGADANADAPVAEDVDAGGEPDAGAEKEDVKSELKVIEKFDPADEANVEEWNKEYTTPEGDLSLERLSSEFWANYQDGSGTPTLNEQTYEFLKSKGISKATVEQVIAAQLNSIALETQNAQKAEAELATMAGGADSLKAMLDWGNEGGYTESQRKQFDAVMDGKDADAKKDAIELLMARYAKATGQQRTKPREPQRDATKGEGRPSSTVTPFKDRAEWRQARNAAGGDLAKLRLVDARAKASGF